MINRDILAKAYQKAAVLDANTVSIFIKNDVDVLIEKIDSNKSLVSALVTSLLKKIIDPSQDIRLHRMDIEGGYSARVLDTQVTSPFFKDNFPKYANKESSFLTLATRERIKWTKEEGYNLKIRDKNLKAAFLNIFENIEENAYNPEEYLTYIFHKLIVLSAAEQVIFENANLQIQNANNLDIVQIIKMLTEFFETKQGSRLPVVAIYSIYEVLIPKFERYKNKKLVKLQAHTSSDKHGFGDIEIYTKDKKPFEIIEIKHNVPIDKYMIFDIVKKTQNITISRYYILTTYKNSFASVEAEKEVLDYIATIKQTKNIDIIANGIITTLKYYLRFMDDYNDFITVFTENLILDAQNSTEVKNFHIERWAEILKKIQTPK
ncbi:MAG: hypothetical protein RLZZ292_569 [Bacteroidota bacterium]|jgi:DNA (cytosine-5)-methyltransferase 1